MRRVGRLLCLALLCALLLSLLPPRAIAVEPVYFTSVNDQLLPLNDATMPFWSGGGLYISYLAFDGGDLGIYCSRSRNNMTVVLYTQQSGALIFDFASNSIYDSNNNSYDGAAVMRGGNVFLPLDTVCRYFDLNYSYTRVEHGYLLRVKSASVVLSDSRFIDAATSSMNQFYLRYERAKAQEAENAAGTPSVPSDSGQQPAQDEPQEKRTVYLAIESTDPVRTETALGYLGSGQAVFLFTPQRIRESGELVCRLTALGVPVALHADASGGTQSALRSIDEGNRALWDAAGVKTRLVYLDGGDAAAFSAAADAGYCPLRFDLTFGETLPSASRLSSRIYAAADARRGVCRVLLGEDASVAGSLRALLAAFRSGNCSTARLTEVTV